MNPTTFFLVILPPIIYDSGYTLHKGNFFQNIGTILVFAIIGTAISAFILGGGIYLLGVSHNVFELQFAESFAFGSLISAVDPVATLAIFSALDLDPILHMLVFGESVLNDAVSIVLAQTALEFNKSSMEMSATTALFKGVTRFIAVFVGSSIIGVVFALIAAIIFKCIKLHRHPALEYGMMMIFIYAPYSLAEGLQLSGIMAILFNGVVMSHYAHYNLSPITQITIQQTLRTLAFICGELVPPPTVHKLTEYYSTGPRNSHFCISGTGNLQLSNGDPNVVHYLVRCALLGRSSFKHLSSVDGSEPVP